MRQLIIGDCHFGVSSNSVVWLENQLKFFNTQIIDILNNKDIDRVVFVGDVFDIRYSVNQQIGIEVKKMFRKILDDFKDIEFFVLAGNHDYYSPLEEFHEYNAYELVFGYEFEQAHPNFKIINNYPYDDKQGNLYLPWYYTENFQNFSDLLYNIEIKEIKNIFCHADLSTWDYSRTSLLKKVKVWSGHIHNIIMNEEDNLYNIGAVFAFNFNDVNQNRYVYILEDDVLVEKIENTTTPKFKRFFNDEIFALTEEEIKNSYIQLCIYNSNINKAKYIEKIKEIKIKYADYNIRVRIIDDSMTESLEISYFNTNINEYIDKNIPEYLNEKYDVIKEKIRMN